MNLCRAYCADSQRSLPQSARSQSRLFRGLAVSVSRFPGNYGNHSRISNCASSLGWGKSENDGLWRGGRCLLTGSRCFKNISKIEKTWWRNAYGRRSCGSRDTWIIRRQSPVLATHRQATDDHNRDKAAPRRKSRSIVVSGLRLPSHTQHRRLSPSTSATWSFSYGNVVLLGQASRVADPAGPVDGGPASWPSAAPLS